MRQKITLFLTACLCAMIAMAAVKIGPDRLKGIEPASQVTKVKKTHKVPYSTIRNSRLIKGKKTAVKAGETWETLLTENFSTLTGGSESAPGESIFDEDGLVIEGLLASSDDWEGWACFQAGGELFIDLYEGEDPDTGEPMTDTGFLSSPYLDLSGNGLGGKVKITLKAKSQVTSDKFAVVIVNDDTEDQQYVSPTIKNSWSNVEAEFDVESGEYYYVQFYPMASPAFIDDITISYAVSETAPAAPIATEATDITATGFTANWKAAAGADSYLVSAFTQVESETPQVNVTEGFDGIVLVNSKNIDTENSTMPEGWTIDLATNGNSRQGYATAGNYGTAAPSLCFDATGDLIQTPVVENPMTALSFWAKAQSADASSSVKVEGYNGSAWREIATITADNFATAGVYNVNFTASDIRAFRLSYTKGAGNVAIDDIAYTSGGKVFNRTYLVTDQAATGTSAPISGFNLEEGTDYYYTVKAVNAYGTSPESNVVRVGDKYIDPDALDTPVSLPATNVSTEGFTANWEEVLSAEFYSVGVGLNHKAVNDETYTLADENFDRQTMGTIDAPVEGDWIADLDEFTNRPDWLGVSTCYAAGCIGFDNEAAMLFDPCLISPTYDIAANGGKLHVKFDVYASEATTVHIDLYQSDPDEDDEEDAELESTKAEDDDEGDDDDDEEEDLPLSSATAAAGPEWKTVEIDLTNGTDMCSFQISAEGETTKFFIDNIQVTKELKAGDAVELPYQYLVADAPDTFVDVQTPDYMPDDTYNYYVVAGKVDSTGEDYVTSKASEIQYVIPTGVQKVAAELGARAYVSNGILRIVNPNGKDINVYNVSGARIYSSHGQANASVALGTSGVYVVKVGNKAIKVIR